jgi:hypothetical protein
MLDTTELQAVGAGRAGAATLPPPPPKPPMPSVAHNPPNQVNQAVAPVLPTVAPPIPRHDPAPAANPFASAMHHSWEPQPARGRPPSHRGRRAFNWLLVLAILGGLVYGAIVYGADLMELATGEESVDEPGAPLVFPVPIAVAPVVRTATFNVERGDATSGTSSFEVTTDFETGIARVVVERTDQPNLEILTLWDAAFVRRVDQPVWYRMDRGQFPMDADLGIARWVRTLDQLVPAALRETAVIERSTRSAVADVPATRLLLTMDPAAITQAIATPPIPPALPDGTVSPAPAPAANLAPGVSLQPGNDGTPAFTIEVWVDDAGIVRKSVLPHELGNETITITSLSPEAWQPIFPTPDTVLPLTASALFQLGI